jgi:hypothetical protein
MKVSRETHDSLNTAVLLARQIENEMKEIRLTVEKDMSLVFITFQFLEEILLLNDVKIIHKEIKDFIEKVRQEI